jgi:exodeoxyribonuclease VII large subunit
VPRPDVLIVARGGGSIEDVWSFNEEIVVRAAADSEIPLISAVGHETDITLIDHVSDRRAPTPTGAAEMAVPVRAELKADIDALGGRLVSGLSRHIERRRTELRGVSRALPKPAALLDLKRQRFDMIADKLDPALLNHTAEKRGRLLVLAAGLKPEALRRDIRQRRERVADRAARLSPALQRGMRDHRRLLDGLGSRVEAFNYTKILARGFAVVRDASGQRVASGAGLVAGQAVELEFADARRQAVIDGEVGATAPKPVAEPATATKPKPKPAPRAKAKNPPSGQGTLF